ncbi:MAG: PAS domain-containing protein [Chlorobiaceae bacterium]|nr:PAS domain-containing protein [Chlorobiaceae bacterium]
MTGIARFCLWRETGERYREASRVCCERPLFVCYHETVVSHIDAAIMQSRHEERVSIVNRNLETLFNSIDDMLFVISADKTIVHVNTAAIEALGYSFDEFRQMNVRLQ